MQDRRSRFRAVLTRNVIVLGAVSLLNDTASEMIIPMLPAFLTTVLGAGAFALGWIEGAADATASVLKLASGKWSDRAHRRRPLVITGYSLTATVRPLIALATAPWHVLAVRVTDRVGKGLRTSPRDALLAASVDRGHRATAFSFHRAMDHTGAILGPLFAAAYLFFGEKNLRVLFWLTAIPSALTVAVLVIGVREKTSPPAEPAREGSAPADPPSPPLGAVVEPAADAEDPLRKGDLIRLLIPLGLFTLGNASDVFLLLKAGGARAPLETLPLLWMGLHVVKASSSVPGGWLADRFGKRRVIGVGWLYYAAIYGGLAYATTRTAVWSLFLAYGIYHGLTEGTERALVSDLVPSGRWGGGFGWYYLTIGLLTFVASVGFGGLWEAFGSRVAFLAAAALALAAVVALAALAPRTGSPRAATA